MAQFSDHGRYDQVKATLALLIERGQIDKFLAKSQESKQARDQAATDYKTVQDNIKRVQALCHSLQWPGREKEAVMDSYAAEVEDIQARSLLIIGKYE